MKPILAESIIVYRSKFEQQQDEGMQQLLDMFASFVINHPYTFVIIIILIISAIVYFNRKSFK